MRREIIVPLTVAMLFLTSGVLAQELPMKVKGGHELGETAEQFFAEGHEKGALSACTAGNFKGIGGDNKRQVKEYCSELVETRQIAISGKREEYQSAGDPSEMRTDTFTFDGAHLVKVDLHYSAPNAESNYLGQTFDQIFAGVKQAYGSPTSESTERILNVYGVPYIAHRELWIAPHAAILITEKPGRDGSTTLVAFTRAEYDHTMTGAPKAANPLE